MNIYVLRHGQTDYNVQGKFQGQVDIPINETGKKQAKQIAQELKNITFDVIFSSPLKRSIQTAKIVTNSDIIIDNRLIERSFGKLEGEYSINNYEERLDEFQIESIEHLNKRVYEFINEIIEKYKYCNNILLTTHACVAEIINNYFNHINNAKQIINTLENGKYRVYSVSL